MRALNVVILDDDPSTCAFLQAAFTAEGHSAQTFSRPEDAETHLGEHDVDLAMVDVYLGAANGIEILQKLRALRPEMYSVVMTAHVSVETAAQSLSEGAVEYVAKPLTLDQVQQIVQRTLAFRNQRRVAETTDEGMPESSIVGRSPKMLEVYRAIGRVAASQAHVLITGPSGTGKELVARAIHQHSKRSAKPFIPVNCGSFTETILESELFGHEKGAFTGAEVTHKGVIESSDGGTLFLDEITETTLSFQVKLLRVIQEGQVRRVGSSKYLPVDVRIVAASNRDIAAMLKAGQFREDLYYRLAVVQITVPPLEDRREDIPLLIQHFLQRFNKTNGYQVAIEPPAIEELCNKPWPGNVRELENTIHRLAIFATTGQITLADVLSENNRSNGNDPGRSETAPMPDRLNEMERLHILRVLQEAKGNRSEAARRLGIERKTLYKKAVRLGIDLQSLEKK